MKKKYIYAILCFMLLTNSCDDYYDTKNDSVVNGVTYNKILLNTDKGAYRPGETVYFTLKEKLSGNIKVRYSHLGKTIYEESLSSTSWSWTPPSDDYKGYMVDLYETIDGQEKIHNSIAVDVSSDWKKFPRYGFLSSYGKISNDEISKNIETLNRYHINGVQFYDWMYDHQRPLAGTVENPSSSWPDLIGRTNYQTTVKNYIDAVHQRGMKAMFYNLAFGALNNAAADGVQEEWYLFKDNNHIEKDLHALASPFRSSIYLVNPANTEWQTYLSKRHGDVYKVFDFDGYHIDQLGNRGTVYDYDGNVVKLDETYRSFITAMKQANPDKRLVMNAVSQYGQQKSISKSEVDFLYAEIWDEAKTYDELAQVIIDNNTYSQNSKSTVLAAYMNYERSNNTGYINTPGILLADAVIFSIGGSHLEVGEHYLTNEYFPNSNLQMKGEMQRSLIHYYDFLVAYQNLLRDGGQFATTNVQSVDGKLSFNSGSASQGSVAVISKKFTDKDVIHLINFTDASSVQWRDTDGTQKEPNIQSDTEIKIETNKSVSRIWLASPDINGGVASNLEFNQTGNQTTIKLPSLKYWDMIVVEY